MADIYASQGQINQAAMAYAGQLGAQSQMPNAPVNPSVFNAFESVQSEAAHLLTRACNLADRLCGAMPVSGDPSIGTALV